MDPDLKAGLERVICDRVGEAVEGASERNSQLQIWRDQLENNSVTSANKTWTNACNICDPISLESFLTIFAQLLGALHRDPKVAVEAFFEEDVDHAMVMESWLSMESSRSLIDKHIYDLAYDACWSQACVGYVGWEQITRKSREVGYRKPGGGQTYSQEDKEDGQHYDEVPMSEVVDEEKFCIRTVDLSDFFLYPPTSKSIDRATMVCERMSVTEEELYDGVGDYGYDEDAVEELCRLGPSPPSDKDEIQASQDGLEIETGKTGFYEIYTVYTRLPRSVPGMDGTVPDYLLQDDFLVVCAPAQSIVLKMAFSPFKERPYFAGGIMPKKDSILGHSLMGMLEGLQAEANANIQFTVDAMNLTMCPTLFGPKSEIENIQKGKVQPGSYIGLDVPRTEIGPLEWDKSPLREGLYWQGDIRNRAQSLTSAQGQGQLQSKVRKQAEIDNLQQQVSAKFGMYLSNFQRTVVAPLFQRMALLKYQFGDVDEDGEEFLDKEGKPQKLTAHALMGKYNIVASGTSLTYSPEARIEVAKQKQQVQQQYLLGTVQLPPDKLPLLWHGARELLFDLGERNPEAWIGDEPQLPEQEQPQQEGLPPQVPEGGPWNGTAIPGVPLYGGNGIGVRN